MITTYLLDTFLETSAAHFPSKTALISGNARLTYRKMDEWANRIANCLEVTGVRRGDRAGIWLDNGPDAAAAIFGVLKAGAIFVPINPSTKIDKLHYILTDCGAKVLITDARKAPAYHRIATVQPDRALAYSSAAPVKQSIDLDLAAIIY